LESPKSVSEQAKCQAEKRIDEQKKTRGGLKQGILIFPEKRAGAVKTKR